MKDIEPVIPNLAKHYTKDLQGQENSNILRGVQRREG